MEFHLPFHYHSLKNMFKRVTWKVAILQWRAEQTQTTFKAINLFWTADLTIDSFLSWLSKFQSK